MARVLVRSAQRRWRCTDAHLSLCGVGFAVTLVVVLSVFAIDKRSVAAELRPSAAHDTTLQPRAVPHSTIAKCSQKKTDTHTQTDRQIKNTFHGLVNEVTPGASRGDMTETRGM